MSVWLQYRGYEPLHVVGFETIKRGGRLTTLRSQGGNARDIVCALREQLRNEEDSEFVGAVVIGLSSKYDLLYEVGRESFPTALRIGWWRNLTPAQAWAEAAGERKCHTRVVRTTNVPSIWNVDSVFLVRVGKHYVGTYSTFVEACHEKEMYVLKRGTRPGKRPSFGESCEVNSSAEALVGVKVSA